MEVMKFPRWQEDKGFHRGPFSAVDCQTGHWYGFFYRGSLSTNISRSFDAKNLSEMILLVPRFPSHPVPASAGVSPNL